MKRNMRRLDFWTIVISVTVILALLFIVYPFSRLFIQSFQDKTGAFSLKNYVKFFSKPYYRNTLRNSFTVCFCTTILATLLGVPLAYLATRFNVWGKRLINILIVMSLMSPPFIGAYSWILLLGRNGFITNLFSKVGIELGSIYGFKGILLVFTLKLFPYVYLYVSGALRSMDASLEEASENLGVSGLKKLLKVTFPVILPTILSSSLMVFMNSLADFGTPLLIGEGYRVLPVAIYTEYISEIGGNVTFASALSVLIIICSLVVLIVQRQVVDRRSYQMSGLRPPEVRSLTFGKRLLATAALFFVAFVAVLPQITVIVTSFLKTSGPLFVRGWSLDSYRSIFTTYATNIRNSLVFSSISIVVMVFLGMLAAYAIVRRRSKMTALMDLLLMFPYVIPGAVLGIGLVVAFNRPPIVLVATPMIMLISYVIRKEPFTLRSSIGILYQIDPSVEEASISLGVPHMRTFFKVTMKQMLIGTFSGAVLSFVATINELSSTLILYTGSTATISVAIFGEVSKNGYGVAAALATILTAITIIILLIFNKVSNGKSIIG